MRKISNEERFLYGRDPRVFSDIYGNYYRRSMREVRNSKKCFAGIRKFEDERGRMTAKDAERILRCAWYGDKVPKWIRVKYPKLSRGIHGQSDLNRQVVENILGRKENANL